jgi:plasmid stabilization system protein ParE
VAEVLWTRQAIEDLDSAPASARTRLVTRVGLLGEFPNLGTAMDGPYDGFRQLLVGRYRVIYTVDDAAEGEVRIAYIRHGARQLGLRLVPDDE